MLTYHVVPGKIMSSDIAGTATMVESVQGSELDVNATDGVTVDGATVVNADIETDNGVIHVIVIRSTTLAWTRESSLHRKKLQGHKTKQRV